VFHCVLLFECENISSQYPNCTKTEASSVAGTRISNVMSFDQSQLSTWLTWRSRHDTLYDVEYRAGVVNLLLFTSEFEILTFLTNSAFFIEKSRTRPFSSGFFQSKRLHPDKTLSELYFHYKSFLTRACGHEGCKIALSREDLSNKFQSETYPFLSKSQNRGGYEGSVQTLNKICREMLMECLEQVQQKT